MVAFLTAHFANQVEWAKFEDMKEILEYMTSGFWVFIGCIIILTTALNFILKMFKAMLWTKRELLFENDRLRSEIEELKDQIKHGTK